MSDNMPYADVETEGNSLQNALQCVDLLSKEVIEIVDNIVISICADLDEYMAALDTILTTQKAPISDEQLDDFTLNLSSLLYFVSAGQENLGIKEDVSKAVQKEIYNKVRQKAKGTVADKDMAAQLQSQNEVLTTIIYSRAYKKVKLRAEAAADMINSVKKVMTRRIAEYEMSQSDRGDVRRFNE